MAIREALRVLEEPFVGSVAVAAGLVTEADLRSRYKSVFRDVYVRADRDVDLALSSRAAHLLLPRQGALSGHSAATLLGAGCSPVRAPAEVIAPRGEVRPRRGLVVRQDRLDPDEVCVIDGHRVTTPLRTAWDLGRRLRLTEAVVAVDALTRVGRFNPEALLLGPPGARGCRRLVRAVELSNPLAESAMETRLRLVLVLGGLPEPVLQHRVVDRRGLVVARLDMAYPEAQLAIEYDGEVHFDDEHSRRDRRRDLVLDSLDWHTLRFTRDQVILAPQDTVRIVRHRLEARLAHFARVENGTAVINRPFRSR